MKKGDIVRPKQKSEWSKGVIEDFWCGEGIRINVIESNEGVIWACTHIDKVEVIKNE